MERWVGKVAIVTGASSGIGAALVEKLVKNGLQVVGLARRVERIEEAARKLAGYPGKLHAYRTDVSNEEDILQAFKRASDNLGPIHILVNNAGLVKRGNTLMAGDSKTWREIWDVNVLGLCVATREAVQNMTKNNVDGHIVHINSIAGHKVLVSNVYSASKYAVTNLTEVLRNELRDAKTKIKVTSVSPGVTDTEIIRRADGDVVHALKNQPKLNSEDVADAVLYTLSTPPHVQVHEIIIKPVGEIV